MKKIGLILALILFVTACSGRDEEPVETKTEAALVEVSADAHLSQEDNQIFLVENGFKKPITLPSLSLGTANQVIEPLMKIGDGLIYQSGDQLLHRNGSESVLAPSVSAVKVQDKYLLFKTYNQLNGYSEDGSFALDHPFEGDYNLDLIFYVPNADKSSGTLGINKTDGTAFQTLGLDTMEYSVEVPGQIILALEDQSAFLFRSPEHPDRLGKLDVATGDTTWYTLGAGRDKPIYGPKLMDNGSILWLFDNVGQVEMVFFDMANQSVQSTDLGPTSDFISFEMLDDGYLIHTKTRVYQASVESINYFDLAASDVIDVPDGLLGLSNDSVRVVKHDSYKDYQFPGKVVDAQLNGNNLIVIYSSNDESILTLQPIDF